MPLSRVRFPAWLSVVGASGPSLFGMASRGTYPGPSFSSLSVGCSGGGPVGHALALAIFHST